MGGIAVWLKKDRSAFWLLGFALAAALVKLVMLIPTTFILAPIIPAPDKEETEAFHEFLFGPEYREMYGLAMYHAVLAGRAFMLALGEELLFRTLPLGLAIGLRRRSWIAVALIVMLGVFTGAAAIDYVRELGVVDRDPVILATFGLVIIACIFASAFTRSIAPIMGIVLSSAAIFAYAHHGWASVPLQGFGGVVLALVYLKAGGMKGRWVKGTWYATLTHTVYNMVLFELTLYALVFGEFR